MMSCDDFKIFFVGPMALESFQVNFGSFEIDKMLFVAFRVKLRLKRLPVNYSVTNSLFKDKF